MENDANMHKINTKIKEIVKSIHNNLSEDKPNEKDNIVKFKIKRQKLNDRLTNLLDKLLTSNTCISEFEKLIKDEEADYNRLKVLKFEEKRLNDDIKRQNKEIKEKINEKQRFKIESEEKQRKDKDRLNKLKAKYELEIKAMQTEYDSSLDTTKKNYNKIITNLDNKFAELEEQEHMYTHTSS